MLSVQTGQQLGDYRLVRLLGEGSFAKVYLGEHLHVGPRAAIKVLHTQFANDDAVERFRKESRIIAQLEHPHIMPILDFSVQEGTPFLVMSYAADGAVRERYPRETHLPLATVVAYVKQVADALQYAHERGIIHHDIKPANILLGPNNEVLLSDFGMAALARGTSPANSPDGYATIPYMAPEYLQGRPCYASDQYALGIVVYEWLTGSLPFHGSFAEIYSQQLFAPAPSLHERAPEVPWAVEEVIRKALTKDHRGRFASIVAFAQALQQASQSVSQPAVSGEIHTVKVTSTGVGLSAELDLTDPAYRCTTDLYVEEALAQLPSLDRSCLLLHLVDGFSEHEIAEILDINEKNVRAHFARGHEHFRRAYRFLEESERTMEIEESGSCADWAKQLAVASLEGPSSADLVALDQHLAGCTKCADIYKDYRLVDARIRKLTVVEPPPGLPFQLLEYGKAQDFVGGSPDAALTSAPKRLLTPGLQAQMLREEAEERIAHGMHSHELVQSTYHSIAAAPQGETEDEGLAGGPLDRSSSSPCELPSTNQERGSTGLHGSQPVTPLVPMEPQAIKKRKMEFPFAALIGLLMRGKELPWGKITVGLTLVMLIVLGGVLLLPHALTMVVALGKGIAAYVAGTAASGLISLVSIVAAIAILLTIYRFSGKKKSNLRTIVLVVASLAMLLSMASNLLTRAIGYPTPGTTTAFALGPTSPVPTPTSRSLLVVLLDRAGNLAEGSSPIDPGSYSTSVTQALADLWPGQMAVVPLSGDDTPLPIFGPATLSDPTQLANLKKDVQDYPIGGDALLGPAMQQAFDLLNRMDNPPGSRVIVITDGYPTGQGTNEGALQEQTIRNDLIPRFARQGIPVSVFGLSISPNTSDGQNANRLFTDIAQSTRGSYLNVQGAEGLATAAIHLYAQWLHLNFMQVSAQAGRFSIPIDASAKRIDIVTFRSNSNDQVTLEGPDGQSVRGVHRFTDGHYTIDTLSGTFVAGTYSIHTDEYSEVQVYVLVSSSLQIQLDSPTLHSAAHSQVIEIEAAFFDGKNVLRSRQGQTQLVAHVRLIVNGQQVGPVYDVTLVQQGATFKGQVPAYQQAGEVLIEIEGSYQGIRRTMGTSLRLVVLPPSPWSSCRLGMWGCFWQRYSHAPNFTLQVLVLLLLLTLLLIFRNQSEPYGYLQSRTNRAINVELKTLSRFPTNLVRWSVIKSVEIENHPETHGSFRFGAASFDLVFKRSGKAYIRPAKNNASRIDLLMPASQSMLGNFNGHGRKGLGGVINQERVNIVLKPGELRELPLGSIILIKGLPVASFEESPY